jgi:hypothetical protein
MDFKFLNLIIGDGHGVLIRAPLRPYDMAGLFCQSASSSYFVTSNQNSLHFHLYYNQM